MASIWEITYSSDGSMGQDEYLPSGKLTYTLPETNIAPENRPSQ